MIGGVGVSGLYWGASRYSGARRGIGGRRGMRDLGDS